MFEWLLRAFQGPASVSQSASPSTDDQKVAWSLPRVPLLGMVRYIPSAVQSSWLLLIALELTLSGVQAQVDAGNAQGQFRAQEAPSENTSSLVRIEIVEDQAAAESRQSREAESDQRQVEDLLAQQGMNEATKRMADIAERQSGIAEVQTWLVAIGTSALLYTLYLTRQANKAAVRAAEAADKTAEITRLVAERQLRAYLAIDGDGSYDLSANAPVRIKFAVENEGQTPADNITVRTGCCLRDRTWSGPLWDSDLKTASDQPKLVLMPRQKHVFWIDSGTVDSPWVPDAENVRRILAGEQAIYLFGQIDYTDAIISKPRLTRFMYEVNVEAIRTGKLAFSATGNDLT